MPNSITVCMTWGGKVEIYVNDELVDTLSPSHRCWSKYIGEYGGMVAPGSRITLNAIPDEGMEFQKYEVMYFPIPPGEIVEVTSNPWSFSLPDQEISIEVYFGEAPESIAAVHVDKAICYKIVGHVMYFYRPVVTLKTPDGVRVAKFSPPLNSTAYLGFRIYIKKDGSHVQYDTWPYKVQCLNADVKVKVEDISAFDQPYLLYNISFGDKIFECTTDKYSGEVKEFSGYLIAPDGRKIPIYSKPPIRRVKVKVNVKEVGYPPTTISATIDDTEIGSMTVDAPGEYEFDAVEVEPGVYTIKAVAVDSIGQRGEASKRVEVG